MLYGGSQGGLEVRREGEAVRVAGRFPYDARTELAPGRFEIIARGAFASRVNSDADLHFLSGHDFEKPLASRQAGTLTVQDSGDYLSIEAQVSADTSWARDFIAAHRAGLIRGLSPGFRLSDDDGAEAIRSDGNTILRTVRTAELFEISAVTRPAYPKAQIEARAWVVGEPAPHLGLARALNRWRA